LQRLATRDHYFVTLNPPHPIAAPQVVASFVYHHPVYTFESLATQRDLGRLNGAGRTWFCGSYQAYGFHEDAVRSATAIGQALGEML
jgi:predicted NAD/FAD-binding protein